MGAVLIKVGAFFCCVKRHRRCHLFLFTYFAIIIIIWLMMSDNQGAEMVSDVTIRTFRRELRALERRVERALAEHSSCCGVTPAQCHAILALEEAGPSSLAEVAAALELDSSTISRTVDGLVKVGLADRREDPTNRRRAILSLSSAGRAAAARINEACDRYYRSLLSSLSEADARGVLRAVPILAEALRAWSCAGEGCCVEGNDGARVAGAPVSRGRLI